MGAALARGLLKANVYAPHDIALFEKAAKSARDPEVKAFAAKTLPTLREHYQHAQQLQASVRTASSPGR